MTTTRRIAWTVTALATLWITPGCETGPSGRLEGSGTIGDHGMAVMACLPTRCVPLKH